MKVIFKKPYEEPQIIEIENKLTKLQELVEGYIEIVPFELDNLICNEEGKITNKNPNIVMDYDYIAGNLIICGEKLENNELVFDSLPEDHIERYIKLLKQISIKKETNHLK